METPLLLKDKTFEETFTTVKDHVEKMKADGYVFTRTGGYYPNRPRFEVIDYIEIMPRPKMSPEMESIFKKQMKALTERIKDLNVSFILIESK